MMAYYRLGQTLRCQMCVEAILAFADIWRMDNPLTNFGSAVRRWFFHCTFVYFGWFCDSNHYNFYMMSWFSFNITAYFSFLNVEFCFITAVSTRRANQSYCRCVWRSKCLHKGIIRVSLRCIYSHFNSTSPAKYYRNIPEIWRSVCLTYISFRSLKSF